jgi:signal transduction histidine kinase
MDTIGIALAFTAFILAGLSLLIISGEKTPSNRIFSLFILSTSLWAVGVFSFWVSPGSEFELNSSNFNYIVAPLLAALFLHFSLIFPLNKKIRTYQKVTIYLFPLIVFCGILSNPHFILLKIFLSPAGVKLTTINSNIYLVYSICFITYISLAYVNLFKSYLSTQDSLIRTQIKFIVIGTFIPYLVGMYFDLILAASNYAYIWVGPLMGFVVVYVIIYSVYKHHLLNTEVITAEILTVGLWIFIAIRTILSDSSSETVSNSVLLILGIIIGIFLIRSIRREVKARKKSDKLAVELSKVNEALADLNLHLSEKVAEQTVEIRKSYDLEKRARRELEKLNETKDQFIMITQHHLRTPVTSIRWGLEEALKGTYGTLQPPLQKALTDTNTAVARLMRIVDDFLSITALKVGSQILTIKQASLKHLLEDVLAELRLNIEEKQLTINFPTEIGVWPELPVDAPKIREVILIVIENAVRYNTQKGSIKITPTIANGMFEMIVENTGIGILSEDRERLFTSLFYRSESARTAHPIGMGVGLSVSRAIMRAHHGELTIASEGKDKGAKAIISIPLARAAQQPSI